MPTAIRFSSDRERKTYAAGLAQVAAKLKGHTAATTAEREAASIAEGKRILASKLSPAAFLHTFGHPAPRTMAHAAKAAAATPARVKAYAKETGPFEPRKLHCFVNRAWLA